jgi:hypothetical protein
VIRKPYWKPGAVWNFRPFPSSRYNEAVREQQKSKERSEAGGERKRVYSAETLGLLILAAVVLIVIVVRYWNEIHWSAR